MITSEWFTKIEQDYIDKMNRSCNILLHYNRIIMPKKQSKSKVLRNVLFKTYEWLSTDYRNKIEFDDFYEDELTKIINKLKYNL